MMRVKLDNEPELLAFFESLIREYLTENTVIGHNSDECIEQLCYHDELN